MNATGTSTRPTRLAMILASFAGRIAAISGSRPRMSVSVWCRVWLQRQVVGSRMIMKDAIWYRPWASQRVRNAVPWPDSCQRESEVEPYRIPYASTNGRTHQDPQSAITPAASPSSRPNQIAVSRRAGPSLRRISCFIRGRGIALRNQFPPASPASTAAWFSGPARLYRASRSLPIFRPPPALRRPRADGPGVQPRGPGTLSVIVVRGRRAVKGATARPAALGGQLRRETPPQQQGEARGHGHAPERVGQPVGPQVGPG